MVAGKRFSLTAPRIPEAALHQQIARVLSVEIAAPGRISKDGVIWWSVDMAGYVGVAPGLRTARGCVAGVPDMLILYRGRAHFIELKAADGHLSPAQCDLAAGILLADAQMGVARSVEGVLELLDCWKIPRARRLRVAG